MSVDTNTDEFQDALDLIQYTRQSVFLTGKAGTGKSTFLRYVCEHTKKKHVVLAPTGIAAINAGGSTMHSFFKLPFYPLLPDDPNLSLQRGRIHEFFKYTKPHRKLLERIELVIIDEISMVRADIIDAIDRILRVYSHNLREPFGVVFVNEEIHFLSGTFALRNQIVQLVDSPVLFVQSFSDTLWQEVRIDFTEEVEADLAMCIQSFSIIVQFAGDT